MKIEVGNYDLKMVNDPYKNTLCFDNINPILNKVEINDVIVTEEMICDLVDFQENDINFFTVEDLKEENEALKEENETLKYNNNEALRSIEALKKWYEENVYNMDLEHLENSTFFDSVDEIKEWLKDE